MVEKLDFAYQALLLLRNVAWRWSMIHCLQVSSQSQPTDILDVEITCFLVDHCGHGALQVDDR